MIFSKQSSALKTGDSATLQFTIIADGKAVDQNSTSFKIGAIEQYFGFSTDKVDKALIGKSVGDTVTVDLTAEEAFGKYDPTQIQIINRSTKGPRDLVVSKDLLNPAMNITTGTIIPVTDVMFYKVEKMNATDATLRLYLNEENTTVEAPIGNVTLYSDDKFVYQTVTNPSVGSVFALSDGSSAKVLSFNDSSIVLDYNSPFAGKDIELKLKVLEIQSSKRTTIGADAEDIPGAPTLEVFVMSYCPYGLQIEKGLLGAYDLLKGKANFKVRFVSYTMHGQKEDDENARQMCIREETKQFWNYLQCFVDKGQGSESQCMTTAGIDESKINDCMKNRAADYLAVDKELNTKYGVQGSPTAILDEKEASVDRSPEAIKTAICDAFTTSKPSECSIKLDSANPSPGFGLGTSTSSSNAQCE